MILLLAFVLALSSCAIKPQDALLTVCVRYVDTLGFLRGRTATFNRSGAARARSAHRFSHLGECVDGKQGPPQRVKVCLVGSSRCMHDRTTQVWADEIERYFKRYPGSYRGKCREKEVADTCVQSAMGFRYPEEFGCLPFDRRCR